MSLESFNYHTTAAEAANAFPQSITGKTFLITGVAKESISYNFILALLPHKPKALILASRTPAKIAAVKDSLPAGHGADVYPITLDLGSLSSVRAAASEITALKVPVDTTVHNAAIMAPLNFTTTADGFEAQMGINHLGHFLFYNLLRRAGVISGATRVVAVGSSAHTYADVNLSDPWFGNGQQYERFQAYGRSKTANLLFALELASRGVKAWSCDPGSIDATGLGRELPEEEKAEMRKVYVCKNPQEGAAVLMVAAVDQGLGGTEGGYLADCKVTEPKEWAKDKETAKKLWKWSEEMVGEKFDF